MYQVGSGGGAVFAHQPGAVNLHRAVADQQRFADFFRGHALQQARGYFAFAPGQLGFDDAL